MSNVTMPTVSWSERFGERNISVELERTIRNSFDVTTGAYIYIAILLSNYTTVPVLPIIQIWHKINVHV